MTRALILAAGQGTRLRPLTDDRPKCLVPFVGKALLDRQTETLRAAGINDIHVVGGYRADQIQQKGYACIINEAYASTNMVETLFTARNLMEGSDDLLICYGDIIYQPENLNQVLECGADICLMIDKEWRRYWQLRLEDPLTDAETLLLDEEDHVTELGKKPQSYDQVQGQYTGLIKIRADKIPEFIQVYDQLDRTQTYDGKDFPNMYMTSFLQELIHQGWKIKSVPVQNGWLEVDSVDDLKLYEDMWEQGLLDPYYKMS